MSSKRLACFLVFTFWSIFPFFGWSSYGLEAPGDFCGLHYDDKSLATTTYILAIFVFCFVVPLMIMIYCYFQVFMTIQMKRHRRWYILLCTLRTVTAVGLLYIISQVLPNRTYTQLNSAPHALNQQPLILEPSSASTPPVNIESRTPTYPTGTRATHRPSEQPKHFLTLITTWNHSNSTSFIQKRTFRIWSKLIPEVQIVVYTDDVMVMLQLQGLTWWYVRKVPKVVTPRRLPVLKNMYIETMNHFPSTFYCYVNSDILFTQSLIKTLKLLHSKYGAVKKPILIVGQRWNVLNITDHEASTDKGLIRSVLKRGELFPSYGADYFITNELYPWENVPDLTIGVTDFDNWLIWWARERHFIAIDVSKTVLAVHQSLTNYSYFSAHKPFADYNSNLLNATFGRGRFYTGRTDCLSLYTTMDNDNDRVVVTQRTSYTDYCYEV